MSDEPSEDVRVYVLVGRAWRGRPGGEGHEPSGEAGEASPVNVLLTAADEDMAVSRALAALATEGYGRAELDRIGVMDGEPDDPTFAAAYWNAVDGEVAVIAFHG